jgi:hypothetical protein
MTDENSVETLADALPKEITRVRGVQDQYKTLRGMPNVMVEPQIMMMEAEIQAAMKAMAEGDVVAMLRVYRSLKEYST